MNGTSRRSVLKTLLGGVLQAAGAVVVARAILSSPSEAIAAEGVTQRADRLAEDLSIPPNDLQLATFSNAAFRNSGGGGGGAFRNGGFANGGGGGAFRNSGGGGGGAFRNGGFANGGGGGAFKNGAFRNY